jgi:hypothetical protein
MRIHRPARGEIEEAKRYPNGCVYRISGHLDPNGLVPPEAIAGAWRVDASGNIIGEFVANPNYDPVRWPGRAETDDPRPDPRP